MYARNHNGIIAIDEESNERSFTRGLLFQKENGERELNLTDPRQSHRLKLVAVKHKDQYNGFLRGLQGKREVT